MSETRGTFFADTVSSTTVQLRPHTQSNTMPDANPGVEIVQVNLVLGGTADAAMWSANCVLYDVIIRRRT